MVINIAILCNFYPEEQLEFRLSNCNQLADAEKLLISKL